jgi:hypothetical protein
METNSKKILAALPDFQDFMSLAEEIKLISLKRMKLENRIRWEEAATFRRIMEEEKFWVKGKPVPVSYFENAFKYAGIDGSLLDLRNELAELQAELELKRNTFEVYNRMLEMHKTLVYQEKALT